MMIIHEIAKERKHKEKDMQTKGMSKKMKE